MTLWLLVGTYIAALSLALGLSIYQQMKLEADDRYMLLHGAGYVVAAFLAASIALLLVLLANAASCTDGSRDMEGHLVIENTCSATRRWYSVLTDWQSGIGALVGLLGLAWSTILKSIMGKPNGGFGS